MFRHPSPARPSSALLAGGGGAALLLLALVRCGRLALGGPAAGVAVGLCLLLLAAAALRILRRTVHSPRALLYALLPVGLALFLRALCLDHVTYDYQDFLSQWAAFFRANGGFRAIAQPVGDYNVPYLYFMAAVSYLPFPDLYAIKLFSILFDLVLAWGGLRLVRAIQGPGAGTGPLAVFLLLLLLPTVVLNGSYWGQCDALYGALVLHAMASALSGRPKGSIALLAIAFSFKLQTVFLIPFWGVLWLARRVKLSQLVTVFPLTYLATILPALLLGKPLRDILGVYLTQAGEYQTALTFNAPSVFSLLPYGAQPWSGLSAVGIALAFLLCLGMMGWTFFHRDGLSCGDLLAPAAVLALGIPFLLPYMHERYFFLADVVTLVWAVLDRRQIPIAVLCQAASLSSYCVYLRLRYTLPVQLFGRYWTMGLEALCMLTALILALWTLRASPARRGEE
ncbi:conjugal transfer protein TraL [Pseudoflavonifractor sp. MSJ-37]|uniref:conjugal transfer protein TraL n=1 Tax=Pseudoflavonifractor sp. MSJ-37 TaxID=2841531 RepID=UPI001C100E85|nr:conjugal transfer protein TraL [Pseudoflavonifractor sp. MSJ-37]MBU5434152.1 conjugal transfer protein TraL [Pseudoflavonifractor sp. MSJ-37]